MKFKYLIMSNNVNRAASEIIYLHNNNNRFTSPTHPLTCEQICENAIYFFKLICKKRNECER